MFETFAIKFLQEVKCQKRATKLLRVTENELSYLKQKVVARGFEGFENFRINVLFYLGKLEMLPQTFM